MLDWKDQFVESSINKSIFVNRNGVYEVPKVLRMDPDWSYIDFLNAASSRIDLIPAAKRVFNSNGVEIDDCMMIEDDDRLFLSQGEAFFQPKAQISCSSNDSAAAVLEGDRTTEKRRPSITVVGPYSIGEVIGKGSFGEVRTGTNQLTGENIALKFIKKSEILSMGAMVRAANEIKCHSILRHNNIIKLEMNMETQKYIVLGFQLMKGGDLFKYLCDRGPTSADASLSEVEARHVFQQVVAGVSYAHNHSIVHRDLKLENILLTEYSLKEVKIADFGLAEFYRPGGTISSAAGTLSFQAPETLTCTNYAGPPLDVWSLGVILFALLCGRLPFEGCNLNKGKRPRESIIREKITKCNYKIDDALSENAKDLIRLMLIIDPTNRATIPDILNHKWMRRTVSAGFGLGAGLMGSGVCLNPDFSSSVTSLSTPFLVIPSTVSAATAVSVGNDQKYKGVKVIDADKIDVGLKNSSNDDRPYFFRPSAVKREEVPSLRLPLTDRKDRHTLRSSSLNKDDNYSLRLSSGDKGERSSFRSSTTLRADYSSDSAFSTLGGASISLSDAGKETGRSSSNSTVKQLSATISDYNLGSYFTADGEPIVRAVVCGDTGPNAEATSTGSTVQSQCPSVTKTQRGSAQSPVTGDPLNTPTWHTDFTVISRLATPTLTPRLPSDISQSHGDGRRSSNHQGPGCMSSYLAGNALSQPVSDPLSHSLTNIIERVPTSQFQLSQSPTLPLGFSTDLLQSPSIASTCVSVPILVQVSAVEVMTSDNDDQSPILIPISPILIGTRRSADGSVGKVLTPTPSSSIAPFTLGSLSLLSEEGTGHLDRSSAVTSCLSDNPTAADSSAWSVTLFKLMPLRRKSRESCYLLDDNDAEMKKISSTILEKQTKVPLLKQATSCLTSRRSRDRSRERDDNRADEEAPGLSKVRRHQPVSKAAGTISEELAKRNMKESDVQIALNHADEGNESSDGEDDYRSGDKAGTTVNMSLGAIDKFNHRFMRKDRNLPSDAVYRGTLGSPISFISEVEIGGKREWQVGKEIIGKDDYADPEEETTVELSMPY